MYPPSDASEEPAERGEDIVNIRRTVDEYMVMCIRVPKKEGETVRSALAESGILRSDHRIKAEGGFLLVPVSSDPGGWELTEADLEPQEAAEKDYRALSEVPAELRHLLPGSYDIIGDVAIIKLEQELLPYRHSVGGALLRVSSNLRTVMLDSGVKGEFRVREPMFTVTPPFSPAGVAGTKQLRGSPRGFPRRCRTINTVACFAAASRHFR